MPSYAVIIRELFPAQEAGLRVSLAISTTLAGMALGGWLAGAIYDWTGSYAAALINGIGWNIVNMAIVIWLLQRSRRSGAALLARRDDGAWLDSESASWQIPASSAFLLNVCSFVSSRRAHGAQRACSSARTPRSPPALEKLYAGTKPATMRRYGETDDKTEEVI